MSNNAHIQKVVYVAEEAAAPLHVPIMVGNEVIIVHQQDVRNIIDTRYLAYSRLGPNCEIIPLIVPNLGQNIVGLNGVIAGIVPCQTNSCPVNQSPPAVSAAFANLHDLVNHFQQRTQPNQPGILNTDCGLETPVAATEQMDCSTASKQLPMTNNVGTSTIKFKETLHRATQCSCRCMDKQCEANIVNTTEPQPPKKKDATTCTSLSEVFKTQSNLLLHSSSNDADDDDADDKKPKKCMKKRKTCMRKANCNPENQEKNNEGKINQKTRFSFD